MFSKLNSKEPYDRVHVILDLCLKTKPIQLYLIKSFSGVIFLQINCDVSRVVESPFFLSEFPHWQAKQDLFIQSIRSEALCQALETETWNKLGAARSFMETKICSCDVPMCFSSADLSGQQYFVTELLPLKLNGISDSSQIKITYSSVIYQSVRIFPD